MKDNGEIILFAIEGKIKHAETTLAKIHKACILLDNNIEHNCSRRHKRRQINGTCSSMKRLESVILCKSITVFNKIIINPQRISLEFIKLSQSSS